MTQTPINTSLILNHTIFNLQTRPNPKKEKMFLLIFISFFFFFFFLNEVLGAWNKDKFSKKT